MKNSEISTADYNAYYNKYDDNDSYRKFISENHKNWDSIVLHVIDEEDSLMLNFIVTHKYFDINIDIDDETAFLKTLGFERCYDDSLPKEFFNGAKLYHFYSVNNIKISGDDIIFKNVYDYPPMINNNIKNWLSTLIK